MGERLERWLYRRAFSVNHSPETIGAVVTAYRKHQPYAALWAVVRTVRHVEVRWG